MELRGGGFKGIITVRAEDVHDHSVNRRAERAIPSSSSLDCGAAETLAEDSFRDARLPVRGGVGSLFSRGQSPTLSVLSDALGALWLPDVVTVRSGVL